MEALRTAMAALGLPEASWSGIRAVVTHRGAAYVHVGLIPAAAAEVLAEALRSSPVTTD
ncbi:hypothetical protein ACIGEZ_33550 [Streptomyces sp. NPDC085481]|uniref:hypothetical protein n=1 Tax=Streptomyces sp. NPDC085481 TaxID=3365727 RepID=UPI0037D1EA89